MKSQFIGYYQPSEDEFKRFWQECLFVFDTSALLNLYEYSEKTLNEYLTLLDKHKERIWMPHQVGLEFHRRRLGVIARQEHAYVALQTHLTDIITRLESVQHPFVPDKTLTIFRELVQHVNEDLITGQMSVHNQLRKSDPVLDTLSAVFESRVGAPYSEQDLERYYKAGADRYSKKIPPGFKDRNKDNQSDSTEKEPKQEGVRRFGDYILWLQIIDEATKRKCPVCLIIDDAKEDWWCKIASETIGPRPELIQEMKDRAGVAFYMYTLPRFSEYANRFLGEKVSEIAIQEAKDVDIEKQMKAKIVKSFKLNKRMFVGVSPLRLRPLCREIRSIQVQLMEAPIDAEAHARAVRERISRLVSQIRMALRPVFHSPRLLALRTTLRNLKRMATSNDALRNGDAIHVLQRLSYQLTSIPRMMG